MTVYTHVLEHGPVIATTNVNVFEYSGWMGETSSMDNVSYKTPIKFILKPVKCPREYFCLGEEWLKPIAFYLEKNILWRF